MAGVAVATPTLPVPHQHFAPFIIIGHTNIDLLVNHIMFWPHQLLKPSSAHGRMNILKVTSRMSVRCGQDNTFKTIPLFN